MQEVESVADELERLLVLRADHAAPGRGAHLDGVRVRDRVRLRLRLRLRVRVEVRVRVRV